MVVRVTVMCFLAILFFVLTVDANGDLSSMLLGSSVDMEADGSVTGSNGACCDHCICTRSIPPQCQCTDIKSRCPSACKGCICTRSIPPQCRCTDITNFCLPTCAMENGQIIMKN